MSYILAIDIGTSSVRAALYDEKAHVLPESMVKNERTLAVTEDGGAEIDAEEAVSQVITAIDDVLKKTKKLTVEIEYVAISSFWHSLVGVDKKGGATTKVLGWADTRSKKYVSLLRENFDENRVHNRTGCRFHSSYWTAKILWLREENKQIFKRTARWLSFSDYLAMKLFGAAVTNVSMASGTGVFDFRKCDWDSKLIEFLKIEKENLPAIATDSQTFQLSDFYAARWQKLKTAKWFLAIGDGAANNIGAGCLTRHEAALMIGTSGAMRVAFEGEPPEKIPAGLWCYRIDRKRILIGGALSDGGGLYRWLKDNLKLTGTDDEIEDEIARRKPDAHGLIFLPFLAGERSTGYNENAQGAVVGLHSSTDAVAVVQAALESVAYRFAEIFDQLNDVVSVKTIIASGGALRESPAWTQIICDTLDQKMNLPDTREASSRGTVLLALETTGKIKNIADLKTPKGRKFKPNSAKHKIYQKARARHKGFYEMLNRFQK